MSDGVEVTEAPAPVTPGRCTSEATYDGARLECGLIDDGHETHRSDGGFSWEDASVPTGLPRDPSQMTPGEWWMAIGQLTERMDAIVAGYNTLGAIVQYQADMTAKLFGLVGGIGDDFTTATLADKMTLLKSLMGGQ